MFRLIVLATIFVAACSSSPAAAPAAAPTASAVEWQDYAPNVQSRIDELAEAKDCPTLQEQFNIAVATQSETLRRTGHNNAKLLGYINDALREAGCYGR